MHSLWTRSSLVRIAPFALFMTLLALRGWMGQQANPWFDPRWLYALTVVVVGGLLLLWRHEYGELSRQLLPDIKEFSLAVVIGMLVFWLWTALDAPWMVLGESTATFVPRNADGTLDWPLVALRWVGAAMVVPLMEELFWRSFLMRWIEAPAFGGVDPQRVGIRAIVLSTFVFVLAHTLWLAAAIAGLAYAWLYIRTGKLWVAVLAHAVTNGALGVWVVATGRWQFW